MTDEPEIKFFSVNTAGETVQIGRATAEILAAVDILLADRMPMQRATELIIAADRGGRDPIETAHMLVSKRQMWRDITREGSP